MVNRKCRTRRFSQHVFIFLSSYVSFHNCYWLPCKWPGVKFSTYAPVFIRSFMKTKPTLCASLSPFCVSTLFLGNAGGPGSPPDFFALACVGGLCPLFSFGFLTSPETWLTHFSYRDRSERIMKISGSFFKDNWRFLCLFSRTLLKQLFCFSFPVFSRSSPSIARFSIRHSTLHNMAIGDEASPFFLSKNSQFKVCLQTTNFPPPPPCAFQRVRILIYVHIIY